MRRTATSSLIIFCAALLFSSCAAVHKMHEDMANGRDKERKAFVEKTNGEVVEASEARLRVPLFGKSSIQLDGDVKIPLKEVVAYQNDEAYYRTTPHGFAPRIKKGLVNVYLASYTYNTYETSPKGVGLTRTNIRHVYYLQKGPGAGLVLLSPETVQTYVSDYAPALEHVETYNQTQRKVKTWSVINTAAVFGGLIVAGTAGMNNETNSVNALGYGGAGLFLGGLVNGFVNKIRRAKNAKNLELAVDVYNGQVTKKKRK